MRYDSELNPKARNLIKPEEAFADLEQKAGGKVKFNKNKVSLEKDLEILEQKVKIGPKDEVVDFPSCNSCHCVRLTLTAGSRCGGRGPGRREASNPGRSVGSPTPPPLWRSSPRLASRPPTEHKEGEWRADGCLPCPLSRGILL